MKLFAGNNTESQKTTAKTNCSLTYIIEAEDSLADAGMKDRLFRSKMAATFHRPRRRAAPIRWPGDDRRGPASE